MVATWFERIDARSEHGQNVTIQNFIDEKREKCFEKFL